MYCVMWAEDGAFHWMGVESGCFPASVMMTCTGLRPPEGVQEHQEKQRRRAGMRGSYNKTVLPVGSVGESWHILLSYIQRIHHFF